MKLSEKLKDFLPGDLDYCFFSDSGSVAVEVALKMALQFNINRGSGRKKLLSLTNSYHGDTFMCMKAEMMRIIILYYQKMIRRM